MRFSYKLVATTSAHPFQPGVQAAFYLQFRGVFFGGVGSLEQRFHK